ncbi:MAG: hypothetical protein H7222_06915 [Methylotenera sp.]|nr:hypothetical protein [Oligoflexia bacterium]
MSISRSGSSSDSTSSRSEFIRSAWIQASEFHDLNEAQVLAEVARRVKEVKARAAGSSGPAHPLVLLDLDSTLYEVGPRTHQILKEWIESAESDPYSHVRAELKKLEAAHIGYSLKDTFGAIGLSLETPSHHEIVPAWESAKSFWFARFFQNSYLKFDHAYPGAAEFTRHVYELGAEIVYLTGRDEPGMGLGTRENLVRDGFPWNQERTHLLMKPTFEMDDLRHKQAAAEYIRKHGTLIASFENEPPNVVAIHDLFPGAMHVFMDTVCSDKPAAMGVNLYRIRRFKG